MIARPCSECECSVNTPGARRAFALFTGSSDRRAPFGDTRGMSSTNTTDPGPHRAVHLAEKLAQFDEHWSPRTVARFNGHDVMVVKVLGEFVWHHHDDTDDLFLVLSGHLTIRLRDGDVELGEGDLFVVPAGVEHQPCSSEGAELLLIEPSGTPNTGDTDTAAPRIEI